TTSEPCRRAPFRQTLLVPRIAVVGEVGGRSLLPDDDVVATAEDDVFDLRQLVPRSDDELRRIAPRALVFGDRQRDAEGAVDVRALAGTLDDSLVRCP